MTALDFALKYAIEDEAYVFPIKADHKAPPLFKDWQSKSSKDPEQIRAWAEEFPGCNWGCDCGKSNWLVGDIDCKPGQNGWQNWKRIILDAGAEDLWTRTHKTSGKGLQFIMKGARKVRTEIKKNVELRSIGHYVVLPGSETVQVRGKHGFKQMEGKYTIHNPAPIEPVPDWLIPLTEPKVTEPKELGLDVDQMDKPHHLQASIDYLLKAEPAVEGSGGNNHTYSIAAELKDRGLTPELAVSMMLQYWNHRCEPPWSPYELGTIVHNAFSYGQNAPGSKTKEAKLAEAQEEFSKADCKSWPISATEFALGKAPPRKWLVQDWFPQNEVTGFYGKGSTGKSLAMMQLAYSLVSGKPWLGLSTQGRSEVLGVFCEDTEEELWRRTDRIRNTLEYQGVSGKGFFLWPRIGHDTCLAKLEGSQIVEGPFMKELRAFLRSRPQEVHKTIILDTVTDVYFGSENVREAVNHFIKVRLGGLIREFNATIIFLGHPSRTGMSTGDMLSGTTAWENSVRNRLSLSRDDDTNIITLRREKSNYAKGGEEIPLVWDDGRLRPATPGDAQPMEERTDLQQYLTTRYHHGDQIPFTELVERLEHDPVISHIFEGLASKRRRRDRLVDILSDGIEGVSYEHRPHERVKHWLVIGAARDMEDDDWAL